MDAKKIIPTTNSNPIISFDKEGLKYQLSLVNDLQNQIRKLVELGIPQESIDRFLNGAQIDLGEGKKIGEQIQSSLGEIRKIGLFLKDGKVVEITKDLVDEEFKRLKELIAQTESIEADQRAQKTLDNYQAKKEEKSGEKPDINASLKDQLSLKNQLEQIKAAQALRQANLLEELLIEEVFEPTEANQKIQALKPEINQQLEHFSRLTNPESAANNALLSVYYLNPAFRKEVQKKARAQDPLEFQKDPSGSSRSFIGKKAEVAASTVANIKLIETALINVAESVSVSNQPSTNSEPKNIIYLDPGKQAPRSNESLVERLTGIVNTGQSRQSINDSAYKTMVEAGVNPQTAKLKAKELSNSKPPNKLVAAAVAVIAQTIPNTNPNTISSSLDKIGSENINEELVKNALPGITEIHAREVVESVKSNPENIDPIIDKALLQVATTSAVDTGLARDQSQAEKLITDLAKTQTPNSALTEANLNIPSKEVAEQLAKSVKEITSKAGIADNNVLKAAALIAAVRQTAPQSTANLKLEESLDQTSLDGLVNQTVKLGVFSSPTEAKKFAEAATVQIIQSNNPNEAVSAINELTSGLSRDTKPDNFAKRVVEEVNRVRVVELIKDLPADLNSGTAVYSSENPDLDRGKLLELIQDPEFAEQIKHVVGQPADNQALNKVGELIKSKGLDQKVGEMVVAELSKLQTSSAEEIYSFRPSPKTVNDVIIFQVGSAKIVNPVKVAAAIVLSPLIDEGLTPLDKRVLTEKASNILTSKGDASEKLSQLNSLLGKNVDQKVVSDYLELSQKLIAGDDLAPTDIKRVVNIAGQQAAWLPGTNTPFVPGTLKDNVEALLLTGGLNNKTVAELTKGHFETFGLELSEVRVNVVLNEIYNQYLTPLAHYYHSVTGKELPFSFDSQALSPEAVTKAQTLINNVRVIDPTANNNLGLYYLAITRASNPNNPELPDWLGSKLDEINLKIDEATGVDGFLGKLSDKNLELTQIIRNNSAASAVAGIYFDHISLQNNDFPEFTSTFRNKIYTWSKSSNLPIGWLGDWFGTPPQLISPPPTGANFTGGGFPNIGSLVSGGERFFGNMDNGFSGGGGGGSGGFGGGRLGGLSDAFKNIASSTKTSGKGLVDLLGENTAKRIEDILRNKIIASLMASLKALILSILPYLPIIMLGLAVATLVGMLIAASTMVTIFEESEKYVTVNKTVKYLENCEIDQTNPPPATDGQSTVEFEENEEFAQVWNNENACFHYTVEIIRNPEVEATITIQDYQEDYFELVTHDGIDPLPLKAERIGSEPGQIPGPRIGEAFLNEGDVIRFSYILKLRDFSTIEGKLPIEDSLIANTFRLKSTIIGPDDQVVQDTGMTGVAEIRIGDAPSYQPGSYSNIDCFEIGRTGVDLGTIAGSSVNLSGTDYQMISRAVSETNNKCSSFLEKVCSEGEKITIYKSGSNPSWFGWYRDADKSIVFYQGAFRTMANLRYTFVHELTHNLQNRGLSGRVFNFVSWDPTTRQCTGGPDSPVYNYESTFSQNCGSPIACDVACKRENQADAVMYSMFQSRRIQNTWKSRLTTTGEMLEGCSL